MKAIIILISIFILSCSNDKYYEFKKIGKGWIKPTIFGKVINRYPCDFILCTNENNNIKVKMRYYTIDGVYLEYCTYEYFKRVIEK